MILDEVYRLSGGKFHVIISDDLDLNSPGVKFDGPKIRQRLKDLATYYNVQPWLAAFIIPNEANLPDRLGWDLASFVGVMDAMIGEMKTQFPPNVKRPIFLSYHHANDLNPFVQLANADGVSMNVYVYNKPE